MIKFLMLLLSAVVFSQNYTNNSEALKLCSVLQNKNFSTDVEAENALERILGVIGASKRFVLQPCSNINNAVATSYKGIRYILYDREFMNSINNENNWGNLFVLAHEVGHHINGHSLDLVLFATDAVEPQTLSQSRKEELEADEFAGFVFAKLGGPIAAANKLIASISTNDDDAFSTHPSRDKRLKAVSKGYYQADDKRINNNFNTKKDLATEYYYKGLEEYKKGNIEIALSYYTTSISLGPNYAAPLPNRALIYQKKGLYKEALSDMNKAIELQPTSDLLYSFRAGIFMDMAKEFSRKDEFISDAISDWDRAIFLNPNRGEYYHNRGGCKYGLNGWGTLKGWKSACEDFVKAKNLGYQLYSLFAENLQQYGCE